MGRRKAQTLVFTSNAQSRKIRKSIPPLVPMPTAIPQVQTAQISLSGADEGRSMESWEIPRIYSSQSPEYGYDFFSGLRLPSGTEISVERDENCTDIKLSESCSDHNQWCDGYQFSVPSCPCCRALKRKSTSPEAPQLCQLHDSKRKRSCKLDDHMNLRCDCSIPQPSRYLEYLSGLSQTHGITTKTMPSNGTSLHGQPDLAFLKATFPPLSDESFITTVSSSGSIATDPIVPAPFEPANNGVEIFASPSIPLSDRCDVSSSVDLEIDQEAFARALQKTPDGDSDEDFWNQFWSSVDVFQATTLPQLVPLPLLSYESSGSQPRNAISLPSHSPEQGSPSSTSTKLSPASITPATPGLVDSLHRSAAKPHKKSTSEEPRYPCQHCDRYCGKRAFKRKDHLNQHLRRVHSLSQEDLVPGFCPHRNCSFAEGPMSSVRAFSKFSHYTKHLREVHGESLFDCSVPNCRRKGVNGYSGHANLLRHMREKHPEIISNVSVNHEYPLECLPE